MRSERQKKVRREVDEGLKPVDEKLEGIEEQISKLAAEKREPVQFPKREFSAKQVVLAYLCAILFVVVMVAMMKWKNMSCYDRDLY